MLTQLLWRGIAKIVSKPAIAELIINRAKKTPYSHLINTPNGVVITSADYVITPETDLYMGRWWLLNPYNNTTRKKKYSWFPWSVRIHHIASKDKDNEEHDHPWDYARTIIIKGKGYWEQRNGSFFWRRIGDTVRLDAGLFHKISHVPDEGVWTLFITKKKINDWGFLINGVKVSHKEYLRK